MQLVIVESPAKAKTIEKYLGGDYRVLASYGHVRDLPPKDGSVNPDEGFAMAWENYGDKARQLKAITDEAKKADRLILATDPDREGEAISWHVQEVLRAKKALPKAVERVTFNAITKATITEAMKHPRELDTDLIDAYRARRALDYLVGFTLSPVLWRKLPGAKSAGRVQSVALRLVVEREREIEAFVPQEYWSVTADLEQGGQSFEARLVRWRGQKIDRLTIGKAGDAQAAKAEVEAGRFTVASVETKPATRNPPPPFTTSTLQQEAARKLGLSASETMRVAQQLYEDGAITYMRTDGVQMDGSAISAARKAIADRYDGGYLPDKPRVYQTKAKNAQEAHEASVRRISRGTMSAQASMPGCMTSSSSARWRARWRRRGWSALRLNWSTVPASMRCGPPGRWCSFPASSRFMKKVATIATMRMAACCPPSRAATNPQRRTFAPSSTSPSRHRATARPVSSSGWRSSASAGPRPMPRLSRHSRTAIMCGLRRTVSSPRRAGGW